MKFSVSVLPQARRDIDRNAKWWAEHHSIDEAVRWTEAIYDQIATLADFPESHGLSPENGDFPYEIRDILLGLGSRPSYRAIFTIRGETVYVLTVRRGAQDLAEPSDVGVLPQ